MTNFSTAIEGEQKGRGMKNWIIGMRRVNKILNEERNGHRAFSTGMYSETVDVIVLDADEDKIIRVYESTNYSKTSYVSEKTATRYRDNLSKFDAEKIFVCSFEENLRQLPEGKVFFEQHGIEVRILGYQD